MIAYNDLWLVPIIALVLQMAATAYLIRIYKKIGPDWTHVFMGFQALGYIYIGMIMYGLYVAAERPGEGVIETYGLFYGFAFPVADRLLHLQVKRLLYKGLSPNKQTDRQFDKKGSAFS